MFYVFAGDHYYPGGGLCDLVGKYETYEKAHEITQVVKTTTPSGRKLFLYDWWQIADDSLNIIDSNNNT